MKSPEVCVSAEALAHNVALLRERSGGLTLFPVLKADAYGHGASLVARILEKRFAADALPYFCLARAVEAKELRQQGLKRPLLILSHFSELDFADFPSDCDVVLSSLQDVRLLGELSAAQRARLRGVHLNFNTGMNRLGLRGAAEAEAILGALLPLQVRVNGMMSHLACAEESDASHARSQEKEFTSLLAQLKAGWKKDWGAWPRWIHLSNSAGLVRGYGKSAAASAARPGLHVWGAWQSVDDKEAALPLQAVMQVRAPLRQIFWAEAGEGVGYGQRFRCQRRTLLGTVNLGYADGIDRRFSRREGEAWKTGFVIEGVRVPFAGNVSMDMSSVDLTDHPKAAAYASGQSPLPDAYWICPEQSVEELAAALGTISYEIFCSLGHRLPRVELSR